MTRGRGGSGAEVSEFRLEMSILSFVSMTYIISNCGMMLAKQCVKPDFT